MLAPIFLYDTLVQHIDFTCGGRTVKLSEYQGLNMPDNPLTKHSGNARAAQWKQIVERLLPLLQAPAGRPADSALDPPCLDQR